MKKVNFSPQPMKNCSKMVLIFAASNQQDYNTEFNAYRHLLNLLIIISLVISLLFVSLKFNPNINLPEKWNYFI